jgi:signal peptidase I
MEKTVLKGEYIFVNKLTYGARMPVTLLSLPFSPSIYTDIVTLPYLRIPGIGKINHCDIIVFNYPLQFDPPIDKKEVMISRCVGLPGDTVRITNKNIFVNNKFTGCSNLKQFNFRIVAKNGKISDFFMKKYEITQGGIVSDIGIYDFPLDSVKLEKVKHDENVRYIRELKDFQGEGAHFIFPVGNFYAFNKDYFGAVIIPYKGQVIKLNAKTLEMYKTLIVEYEKNKLEIKNHKVYINNIPQTTYIIKDNYYFVVDDNRDNAKDSRYWGFLPESHIIGKASFVWFSYDSNNKKIRWKRIFSSLN